MSDDTFRAAIGYYYDLLRVEAFDIHQHQVGDPVTAPSRDEVLQRLLEERMSQFQEWLEMERDEPELIGDRHLEDPEQVILDEIRQTVATIARLQERVKLQVAYAREFTPDPPRLVDVAAAAEVSRTQIGRMYDQSHVDLLAGILGLTSPRTTRESLRRRDDLPTTGIPGTPAWVSKAQDTTPPQPPAS